MNPAALIIAMVAAPLLALAEGHPADDARAALEKAQGGYEKAEKEFLASTGLISDAAKKKAVIDAFAKRKEAGMKAMELDAELKVAASAGPEGSTSTSLIPYWSDARHLNQQAALLQEQAKWIRESWTVQGEEAVE